MTQYEKRQAKAIKAIVKEVEEATAEDKQPIVKLGSPETPVVPSKVMVTEVTPPKEAIPPKEVVPTELASDTKNYIVDIRPSETAKKYGAVSSPTQFPKFAQANLLQLDPGIEEHLTGLGFKWRFIDWGEYCKNTYMHPSQWRPFEFSAEVRGSNRPWALGIDAEGLIRRKDLVLAVRPTSLHEEHKAKLGEMNRMYRHFEDKKAEDFREFAQQRGEKTNVTKGSVTQTRG